MNRERRRMMSVAATFFLVLGGVQARAQGQASLEDEEMETPAMSLGVGRLVAEIRDREGELKKRSLDLDQRERSVSVLEAQISERLEELHRLREEFEERVDGWMRKDGDRVQQLAKVYSAMPPARAAGLLEQLEMDVSVLVVRKMKQKQSAAVLSAMTTERALAISRRLIAPLEEAGR